MGLLAAPSLCYQIRTSEIHAPALKEAILAIPLIAYTRVLARLRARFPSINSVPLSFSSILFKEL